MPQVYRVYHRGPPSIELLTHPCIQSNARSGVDKAAIGPVSAIPLLSKILWGLLWAEPRFVAPLGFGPLYQYDTGASLLVAAILRRIYTNDIEPRYSVEPVILFGEHRKMEFGTVFSSRH